MAKLIYSVITSLDGFIADKNGDFDWAAPDEEVHAFVNDLVRPIGSFLYGRHMYEVMIAWETMPTQNEPPVITDFADIWRTADKIVYSTTLEKVSSARTRLERQFNAETLRQMLNSSERDIGIGGPALARYAFKAGLVEECHLFVVPIIIGSGQSAFPTDVRIPLRLQAERRFANGMVYLHYHVERDQAAQ